MESLTLTATLLCGALAMMFLAVAKRGCHGKRGSSCLIVKDYEKDKVYLFSFRTSRELINHSPFCAKVVAYLWLRKIPYAIRVDKFPGPRGQLPFIELNGKVICDSDNIVWHLDQYFSGPQYPPLSAAKIFAEKTVSAAEKAALATAIQRIIEDSLYWKLLYFRWATPEGWQTCKGPFFQYLPIPLRYIVPAIARRQVVQKLGHQGTLRLPLDEMCRSIEKDIEALSHLLGDKGYFLSNDQVTLSDITVFAWLDNVVQLPFECPLKSIARSKKNLLEFCQRMRTGPLAGLVSSS